MTVKDTVPKNFIFFTSKVEIVSKEMVLLHFNWLWGINMINVGTSQHSSENEVPCSYD